MTISRNYIKKNNSTYEINQEQWSQKADPRVKWIYEQYHSKKAVTLDDFQYLKRKDPESCQRLIRSMIEEKQIEPKNRDRIQREQVAMECIEKLENAVSLTEQKLEQESDRNPVETRQTLESVKESLSNVKDMMLVMDQNELEDMMDHLYEVSSLREQYEDELMGWEMLLEETDRYYSPFNKVLAEYFI